MHGLMTGLVQNAENTLNELTQGVVNGISGPYMAKTQVCTLKQLQKIMGLAQSLKQLGFGAEVLGCRVCACDMWCPMTHVSLSCICGRPFKQWSYKPA